MCRRYGWGNSSETGNKKKGDDDDVSDDDDDVELNDGGEPVDMTETDDSQDEAPNQEIEIGGPFPQEQVWKV